MGTESTQSMTTEPIHAGGAPCGYGIANVLKRLGPSGLSSFMPRGG